MDNNELYHYGVKGMKWGVRKQYIKAKGRIVKKKAAKAYADIKKKVKARREAEKARQREADLMKKPVKKLTNAELQERAKILESRKQVLALEKSCKDLNKDTTNAGKAFMKDFAKDAIGAAAIGAGKTVLMDYFTKIGKDKLGLSAKDVKGALPETKTWADMINKQTYEANARKAKKEAEAEARNAAEAEAKAAKEDAAKRLAEAQKQVDDYNKQWAAANQQSGGTYSKSGSALDDAATRFRNAKTESHEGYKGLLLDGPLNNASASSNKAESNTSSNKTTSSKKDDSDALTGTVVGEGTSKYRGDQRAKNDYDVDVDLAETDLTTIRNNTSLVSTGSQYVQYLLEDKSK